MFSQACVKNSVHEGMSTPVRAGIHTPWQTPPRADTLLVAATAADSTNPTGMHSSYYLLSMVKIRHAEKQCISKNLRLPGVINFKIFSIYL